MFFHGIDYKYLLFQFPVLSPRLSIKRLNTLQHNDRKHLICRFGFEPVHFLESSERYPTSKCLTSCFTFGEVIVVYRTLPLPILQLSANEVGTPVANMLNADFIIARNKNLMHKLRKKFPDKPIFLPMNIHFIEKIKKFKKMKGNLQNMSKLCR